MLQSLSIRNVVLIDTLDVSFDAGLCALTGETGAGKSILLGALGLAAGDRAERGRVREGADEARAVAEFELAADHPAYALLEEAELDIEPGEPVILRRRLGVDGRSRAFINDQAASIGLLRRLGEALVEVQGQHDGRGLLDPSSHRGLLDAYAGHADLLTSCKSAWTDLAAARDRLESLQVASHASAAEQDFLRDAVAALDALDAKAGEDEDLAEERRFLMGAEKAMTELEDAQAALAGDGGGMEARLSGALRGLERVRDQLGSGEGEEGDSARIARDALEVAAGALDRALIEFGEAGEAMAECARAFELEPGRLEAVEERLFALRAASRKHECDVDDLPMIRDLLADKLDSIDHAEDRLAEAQRTVTALQEVYDDAASALSASRRTASGKLQAAIEAELPDLKMEKARLRIGVSEAAEPGPAGRDRVQFEVATNPGAPFGALDKIASGGELSRFALALKVALAGEGEGLVLVFDEVDQGVGGAVADAVGRRLQKLAAKGQTLVVTHSPQVAARADHHWKIEKAEDGEGGMRTTLVRLDGAARREEIARMLSGANVTEAARAQADELMGASA
jgi:DNA repair protein RecN (Recombination protein N)